MVRTFMTAFLTLLYLSATVGVAVHECGCGNSGKVELFVVETSCTCHHSDSDCCGSDHDDHDERDHDDDQDCQGCHCATVYKSVDSDEIPPSTESFSFKTVALALVPVVVDSPDLHTPCITIENIHSPPRVSPVPLIYRNCQLRL